MYAVSRDDRQANGALDANPYLRNRQPLTSPTAMRYLSLVLLLVLLAACKSTRTLESRYPSAPLEIDGRLDDWQGQLTSIADDKALLGIRHDDRYLYVAFTTDNPGLIRQIMATGLVLWIDPAGKQQQTWGLHYPLGLLNLEREDLPARNGRMPPEAQQERFQASLAHLAILRDEGASTIRHLVSEIPALTAAITATRERFVYELRLPLAPEASAASLLPRIVSDNHPISVGLETPEINREALRERFAGRRPMGNGGERPTPRGGFGGGGWDRVRGQRSGEGFQRPEPLRTWVRVKLAENAD